MAVDAPLRAGTDAWSGYDATLRRGRRRVPVTIRPVESSAPRGTTISVDLHATRNRSGLTVDVTAQAEGVAVRASLDDREMPVRRFSAPRRREADLLAETIDAAGQNPVAAATLAMAAELVAAA
jgi:hypothetical protein